MRFAVAGVSAASTLLCLNRALRYKTLFLNIVPLKLQSYLADSRLPCVVQLCCVKSGSRWLPGSCRPLIVKVIVCCFVLLLQAQMSQKHPQVMQLLQEYAAAKAAVSIQQQQQPDPQVQGISRHACALTLLGTGSSRPNRFRNVSSYYMDLFDKGGLLMDCGKGQTANERNSNNKQEESSKTVATCGCLSCICKC